MEANIGFAYGEAMAVLDIALRENGIALPGEASVSTAELSRP